MAKDTKIEWCDSTGNLQMGCNGCELWNPKAGIKKCYAGVLTDRHGGIDVKGWPESFDKPKVFMERLKPMLNWPDLTGKERPEKPWLNGYPRTIFLDDMGDTFTESLPIDWLAPAIPLMEESPHIFQVLTKRPKRMKLFFDQLGYVPKNFWLMTTVTNQSTLGRVYDLLSIKGATVRGVSCEPLWGTVELPLWRCANCFEWVSAQRVNNDKDWGCIKCGAYLSDWHMRKDGVNWIIGGFESGYDSLPGHPEYARRLRDQCLAARVPFFWKQNGEWAEHQIVAGGDLGGDLRRGVVEHVRVDREPDGLYKRGDLYMRKVGKKNAGRLLDGRTWNEMPKLAEAQS